MSFLSEFEKIRKDQIIKEQMRKAYEAYPESKIQVFPLGQSIGSINPARLSNLRKEAESFSIHGAAQGGSDN